MLFSKFLNRCLLPFLFSLVSTGAMAANVALLYANYDPNPQYALDDRNFEGFIEVENLGADKEVLVHYSIDGGNWQSLNAEFTGQTFGSKEAWEFNYTLPSAANAGIEYAVEYKVGGQSYWDSNYGQNYLLNSPVPYFNLWNLALVYAQRSDDGARMKGLIKLRNIAYHKIVKIKYTNDNWATHQLVDAHYSAEFSYPGDQASEAWSFDFAVPATGDIEFLVEYTVDGVTYLDNNIGNNFRFTEPMQEIRGQQDGFVESTIVSNLQNPLFLRGSFNAWTAIGDYLTTEQNSVYTVTAFLTAGTHQFKFADADWSTPVTFGGFINDSVVILNETKNISTQIIEPDLADLSVSVPVDGSYQFVLDATDVYLPTVTVSATNTPPVANAGADQSVALGQLVQLDASASFDTDGQVVDYQWDNGLTGVTPTFVATQSGIYLITLTVTDDAGATHSDTVSIDVAQAENVATGVAAGGNHTCVLRQSGTVRCIGYGNDGQLGHGVRVENVQSPVDVQGLGNAVDLSAGAYHNCAVVADGRVFCWGRGAEGQLGHGSTSRKLVATEVVGIDNALSVVSGQQHSCALLNTREISCWGNNQYGQLGNATAVNALVPVMVSGINNAIALAAGRTHNCAILDDNSVMCWGQGDNGQLGNNDVNHSSVPVTVVGMTDATDLAAGGMHSCAVQASGAISCWGDNLYGQLGDGTTDIRLTPVTVVDVTDAVSVHTGFENSCVVTAGETARCWGKTKYGQLGNAMIWGEQLVPDDVLDVSHISQLSSGYLHAVALNQFGEIWAWGNGTHYKLAFVDPVTSLPDQYHQSIPVQATGF